LIGLSRIYVGVHFPSDVIGGYLLGASWLTLMIGLFPKLIRQDSF
ncbi:MAG: phosphatase PAP2 family protein, partial [Carnobacterium sp.]|nr:phosphatase PAP2 family protein [Carnobacterium sp.]